MTFKDSLQMTDACRSSDSKNGSSTLLDLVPGTYGQGLISILADSHGQGLLNNWVGSLHGSGSLVPIMYTGFGDVIVKNREDSALYFLETQRGHMEFLDRDLKWMLDEFLLLPNIRETVLKQSKLTRLVNSHGALTYGQIFILQPWEMMGGDPDDLDSYTKGDLSTYLSLVGQALGSI